MTPDAQLAIAYGIMLFFVLAGFGVFLAFIVWALGDFPKFWK